MFRFISRVSRSLSLFLILIVVTYQVLEFKHKHMRGQDEQYRTDAPFFQPPARKIPQLIRKYDCHLRDGDTFERQMQGLGSHYDWHRDCAIYHGDAKKDASFWMLGREEALNPASSIKHPASFSKEDIMQKPIWIALLTILLSGFALAQSNNERRVSGYVFAAPGSISDSDSTTLHIGGGVEGRVYRGLGVGGEIGFLGPASSLEDSFGIFSANGSYHFSDATQSGKLVPFVTGGYSLFFREGTANAVNLGGGVNYWFKDRLGLRIEVRDHVLPEYRTHYWGVRFGLSFR